MTVTFFGHRFLPECVRQKLRETVIKLIEERGAKQFLVGNEGDFDRMARQTIRELEARYPGIRCTAVLSRMPTPALAEKLGGDTLYPTALLGVPYRFAIEHRNRWMVAQSDLVVTAVASSVGGAAKAKAFAARRGKEVIEVYGCASRGYS